MHYYKILIGDEIANIVWYSNN